MLTDTPLCVADVLERAADLIEPEGRWVREDFARAEDGTRLARGFDDGAYCWCVLGAVENITGNTATSSVYSLLLREVVGGPVTTWNDVPERTQPEVVAALRRAATLARAGDA